MSAKALLRAIYANEDDLPEQVRAFIDRGTDLDALTGYGESPLRVASNHGRFDVVRLLIDGGADWYQLGWTHTIEQVVFGTLASIRASVLEHDDLERTDYWNRTPLLVAILTGDTAKAALLLDLCANAMAVGRCGKTAPMYAIDRGHVAMLQWLADQGFDMEARDDFGCTPLMEAAEAGKADCVRFLARLGVNLYKTNHTDMRALQMATDIHVVRTLVEFGDDLSDMSEEAHASLVGVACDGEPAIDKAAYRQHWARTFGATNPERTDHAHWIDMIRCGASAWRARDRIGGDHAMVPGWCFNRFGRSTTVLADGRIIDIGGEHEDWYDPDFCIYNDVTVFDGQGGIAIYSYPPTDFPPTDFHSATLVDDSIYIIGGLGYSEARRPGTTPVFRLDLPTLRITAVTTTGQCPGWIYKHKARLMTDAILVSGGSVEVAERCADNPANTMSYRLCLRTFIWTRQPPC